MPEMTGRWGTEGLKKAISGWRRPTACGIEIRFSARIGKAPLTQGRNLARQAFDGLLRRRRADEWRAESVCPRHPKRSDALGSFCQDAKLQICFGIL